MLTLFAAPKPFEGHAGTIQRNAIGSWVRLSPACEILLFGSDVGVGDAAQVFGARHIPDPACSEFGTPLIGDVFARAEALASNDVLCYLNADIIPPADFVEVVAAVAARYDDFLLIGRRTNIDLNEPLDFAGDWQGRLAELADTGGRLHDPTGIDYFAFRRGMLRGYMPPFAVGRVMWDNWLIYWARINGVPVIDATGMLCCLHQNHGYGHIAVQSGSGDYIGEFRFDSVEHNRCRLLGFSDMFAFDISDATHCLVDRCVVPASRFGRRPRAPSRQTLSFGMEWLPAPDVISRQILYGQFEPNELAFVRRYLRSGMTVVDVGAHHGIYTMLAAHSVGDTGRVLAVEASPREFVRLRMHTLRNGLSNVEALPIALGGRTRSGVLLIDLTSESGRNTLRATTSTVPQTRVPVEIETLDAVLLARGIEGVDLLKIDVAGAESDVLAGAITLLSRCPRPVLLCDMDESLAAPWSVPRRVLFERLEKEGFFWFMAGTDGLLDACGPAVRFDGPLIAVPRERLDLVELAMPEEPLDLFAR